MRVLELYSGIGGMHYALEGSTVEGTVVTSIDINTTANKVYKHNFPRTTNLNRNIESLTEKEISKLCIDCILMSPPCQPFTRVGLKKDSEDNRCTSLLHVLKLIPHIDSLKYILLENVKGFECSQAMDEVIECLRKSGFNFKEFILSPCQFGIPNSRHRYYLIAKKQELKFVFGDPSLLTSIPDKCLQLSLMKYHDKLSLESSISDNNHRAICFEIKHILEDVIDAQYSISNETLLKRGNLLDIRTPESRGSCCFTKAYTHYVEGTGSVLTPYLNLDIEKQFEKFNSDKSLEERLEAVLKLKLRYFTPKEVSRLLCFPNDFEFPSDMTNKQKYRLLGNSINIHVVSQLINLLHYEGDLQ